MTKILIIINPNAGDKKGTELGQSLDSIYKEKEIETKIYETKGQDDFKKLVKESMDQGYQKIVVSGGDGTISELVNGIADLEERPNILLIPSGTVNNFARTIGSKNTREEFLKAIETDELVEIEVDVGCVDDKYFISSIAVGLLPAVGWETDAELKADIGSFAYIFEGIKAMTKEEQETFDIQIHIGQEKIKKDNLILFIVSLSNSIMGIKTFFEGASIDDKELHFFGIKKSSLIKEASALIKQVVKKSEASEDKLAFTGSFEQAVLHSDSEFNFLIDGEKGPSFPINLSVMHNHLTFEVPKLID